MSVRDPFERVKSAYNWQKYKCSNKGGTCFSVEPIFLSCYTTLNAFSERSCDGPLCGDGWDETKNGTNVWKRFVERSVSRGWPLHSCDDAFRTTFYGVRRERDGTWPFHRSDSALDR